MAWLAHYSSLAFALLRILIPNMKQTARLITGGVYNPSSWSVSIVVWQHRLNQTPKKIRREDGKPQIPAEREQEDKNVDVILFCTLVQVTFVVVGMQTTVYVIIAGLVSAMLIYE
jgi:hypothetical protein